MNRRAFNPLLALVLVGVLALIGGVTMMLFGLRGAPQSAIPETPAARVLPSLPHFALHSSQGEVATEQSFAGHWTLLFFGYTSCPDVCPTTLTLLTEVRRQLRQTLAPSALPRIVMVTVDAERDSPQLLARYLAAFDPEAVGLSGDDTELDALARPLGAFHARGRRDAAGHYVVDHSAAVYLIGPDLKVAHTFLPPLEASRVVASILQVGGQDK